MPKDTFHNLPADKRRLIENAALDEFAVWGFDNASINRIVAATGIAKGSFYQYFADKEDLFRHLILGRIAVDKLAYISPVMANPFGHDFYTVVTDMYRAGLAFGRDDPQAARVANLVFKNQDHPVYRAIIAEGMGTARALYGGLLQKAMAAGEVRADLNLPFAVHMLVTMTTAILDFYVAELQEEGDGLEGLDDGVMETVAMAIDFIKHGISASKELAP